jgi:hypothetical protein
MLPMNYKTEEIVHGKLETIFHPNIKEAKEWQHSGFDVKLFRKDGEGWVESGSVELKLMELV